MLTEWYEPYQKPKRVGYYEISFVDLGWTFEWKAWWDGRLWRDAQDGWALHDQQQTWRGLTEPSKEAV